MNLKNPMPYDEACIEARRLARETGRPHVVVEIHDRKYVMPWGEVPDDGKMLKVYYGYS